MSSKKKAHRQKVKKVSPQIEAKPTEQTPPKKKVIRNRKPLSAEIPAEGLLNTRQAAAFLGVQESTLVTGRCTKDSKINPPFAKLGGAVRYRRADLEAYIEQHMQTV